VSALAPLLTRRVNAMAAALGTVTTGLLTSLIPDREAMQEVNS